MGFEFCCPILQSQLYVYFKFLYNDCKVNKKKKILLRYLSKKRAYIAWHGVNIQQLYSYKYALKKVVT